MGRQVVAALTVFGILSAAACGSASGPQTTATTAAVAASAWPASYRTSQIHACTSPPGALSVPLCTCLTNYMQARLTYSQMLRHTAAVSRIHKAAGPHCIAVTGTKVPSAGTKLAPSRESALHAEATAWNTAIYDWASAAQRCRSSGSSCLQASYTKWLRLLVRAERDARADAKTVTGACRGRLLDYLGSGGAGDALTTAMAIGEKEVAKRDEIGFSQTLQNLVLPALRATIKAVDVAQIACYS